MKTQLLKDVANTWHPYKNPDDHIWPYPIVKGEKEFVIDSNGRRFFDSGASWWTNIHGHSHPYIAQKVYEQFLTLEHVIFAGYYHEPAALIAKRICQLLGKENGRAFFSDNGSTAVEVAVKAAILYQQQINPKRKKIIALESAYHGDTFGAMSVSGRSIFTDPYNDLLFDVEFIPVPDDTQFEKSLSRLDQISAEGDVATFIFEPLIQGAGGMNMYPAENLEKLLHICREREIVIIADEVMTGFGRTANMFATDAVETRPDIFSLSKGLTGGTMPLGLTVFESKIYDLLEDKKAILFHGHSFTAHPLACAAANASLDLYEKENVLGMAQNIAKQHREFVHSHLGTSAMQNLRSCGIVLAFEVPQPEKSYASPLRGKIIEHFRDRDILLRPLGNTVYLLPPMCTSEETLQKAYQAILELNP